MKSGLILHAFVVMGDHGHLALATRTTDPRIPVPFLIQNRPTPPVGRPLRPTDCSRIPRSRFLGPESHHRAENFLNVFSGPSQPHAHGPATQLPVINGTTQPHYDPKHAESVASCPHHATRTRFSLRRPRLLAAISSRLHGFSPRRTAPSTSEKNDNGGILHRLKSPRNLSVNRKRFP